MKKIFDFIKSLFSKADVLEKKVENFVENSDFISTETKKTIKSKLNKLDDLEAKAKNIVEKAEKAEDKIETAIKNKDIVSATIAVESIKDIALDTTNLANDVKTGVKKVKKEKSSKK
jgi:translation elongation factor EF-Tu-like GTPase